MTNTTKTALITGAGRRFGYELANHLLDLGYRVFAHYNTSKEGVEALEEKGAIGLQADFSDLDAVAEMIAAIKTQTNQIDLLVNNASAFFTNDQVDDSDQALATVFSVHALVPYLLMRDLASVLKQSDNALIVNITDIYTDSPATEHLAYCAAKAALANLTQGFAKSLAPKIRVNGIQPGPILFLPDHDDEHREKVMSQTPLQVEGGLQPMIETVLFLRDNPFITGEFIKVDGGRALMI